MDVLKEYLGLIQEFPRVGDIHRGALGKIKDCERMKEEGRIDVSIIYTLVYPLSFYNTSRTVKCSSWGLWCV